MTQAMHLLSLSKVLLCIFSVACLSGCDAFAFGSHQRIGLSQSRRRVSGVLPGEGDRDDGRSTLYASLNANNNWRSNNNSNNPNNRLPVIPVIGPIINIKPLMVSGEMILNPTPLQWKALQECVVVHRNQLSQSHDGNNSNSGDDMETATIDAAPLIAIIDEPTGETKVQPPFSPFQEGGRYATLAAVVGITPSNKSRGDLGGIEETSFMDYVDTCAVDDDDNDATVYSNMYSQASSSSSSGGMDMDMDPLSSTVRLVGIGRAVLRKFFYRVPTELCVEQEGGEEYSDFDESSFILIDEDEEDDEEGYINHIFERTSDNFNYGYDDNTPIVMSTFEPLVDDVSVYSSADPNRIGEKGQRSYRISPVHALSSLNNISIKVAWAHDDRRKLVRGIQAAKSRLELNMARRRGEIEYDDGLYDVDGLGALFENNKSSNNENEAKQKEEEDNEPGMTVDEFLATFKGNMMRIDPSELPQNQPSALEKLERMENYGMGYYGSFSSIADLTAIASTQLAPYYSKSFRQREEYDLEVSSFVAFRALEGYAEMGDITWSLQCTSSYERLTRAYEILLDHTIQLKKMAEKLSHELRECGEECTDLW